MEKVICDLCGADAPISQTSHVDRFSGDEFDLATCSNCGLVYLPVRPSGKDLDDYYPEEYEAYYLLDNISTTDNWHLRRALNLQLKFVDEQSNTGGRSLLDVGCATGNFLMVARENGWNGLGIEPVQKAAQLARDYYGLEVISGTLESADLPFSSFDVITMWDVLEHLPSPKQAFQKSWELLKPGGNLVFSIPNLTSFDRYLFGKYWIGWDTPRHFNLFTNETLQELFKITGFTLRKKKCILGGKGTFQLSLDMVIDQRNLSPGIKKLYPMVSALLWPYRQLSYLVERGPIITYCITKLSGS